MRFMMLVMPIALLLLLVPLLIGVYVYRDARRREMNALLWALIAVLAPGLIGFLVYLLVRGNVADLSCPQCGAAVREDFVRCPHCGTKLRPACPNCSMPVEPGWVICPRCTTSLEGVETEVHPPIRRADRSLWKVLLVAVLVPLLLLVLLVVANFSFSGVGGAMSMIEMDIDDYLAQPDVPEEARAAVEDWLHSEAGSELQASALLYEEKGEEENRYEILLHVPTAGNSPRSSMGQSSSLFGTKMRLEFERTGNAGTVLLIRSDSRQAPRLEIRVDGEKLPCTVERIESGPLPEEPVSTEHFQELFLLRRYLQQGEAGEVGLDEMQSEKLENCLIDAPYLDTDHPIYQQWAGIEDYYELFRLHEDGSTEVSMLFLWEGNCYLLERNTPEDGRFIRQLDSGVFSLVEDIMAENLGE